MHTYIYINIYFKHCSEVRRYLAAGDGTGSHVCMYTSTYVYIYTYIHIHKYILYTYIHILPCHLPQVRHCTIQNNTYLIQTIQTMYRQYDIQTKTVPIVREQTSWTNRNLDVFFNIDM